MPHPKACASSCPPAPIATDSISLRPSETLCHLPSESIPITKPCPGSEVVAAPAQCYGLLTNIYNGGFECLSPLGPQCFGVFLWFAYRVQSLPARTLNPRQQRL